MKCCTWSILQFDYTNNIRLTLGSSHGIQIWIGIGKIRVEPCWQCWLKLDFNVIFLSIIQSVTTVQLQFLLWFCSMNKHIICWNSHHIMCLFIEQSEVMHIFASVKRREWWSLDPSTNRFASDLGYRLAKNPIELYKENTFNEIWHQIPYYGVINMIFPHKFWRPFWIACRSDF